MLKVGMPSFKNVFFMLAFSWSNFACADEVNIYSARHYDTDMEMYYEFTRQTGIQVNLIEGSSDALIQRLLNEAELSPADLLITVDAGRLWRAQQEDLFQAIQSDMLEKRIPSHLRHPQGLWFGLSKRARVIVHSKDLDFQPKNYEDLASPELRGLVCMRSSSNIYNLSLMASLIAANSAERAEKWANALVANFARKPQGNDTAQLRAVASGECGVTIANTYYLGRFLASEKEVDKEMLANLEVIFPNQLGRGTHINISGAGVVRHSPNKENAIEFLEYLTNDFAQKLFSEGNNEYPIIGEVSGPIRELGVFKEDKLLSSVLGANQREAVMIFDRAGWR